MHVQVLDHLDPAQQATLDDLVRRVEEADQHPALSEDLRGASGRVELQEHQALAVLAEVGGPGGEGSESGEDRKGRKLVGCATLTPGGDGFTALHVAVDPAWRPGKEVGGVDAVGTGIGGGDIRGTLIAAALERAATPVRLWIMQADDTDDRAMASTGFRPERDLLQMRVPLPLPADVVAATRPVATRPFRPGPDDEVWLSVNNRAFAGHPEQGHWTLDTLHGRQRAAWFDPAGFLVAEDTERGGLIGSCWTKVHRQVTPALGEIYVISVEPSRHGQGWGRALTVAGLQWLSGQGLTVGMLYTDASNGAAVALYRSLGFTVDHIDRSYVAVVPPPAD